MCASSLPHMLVVPMQDEVACIKLKNAAWGDPDWVLVVSNAMIAFGQ